MEKNKIRVLFTIPNFDTAGSGKALLNVASRLNKEIFEPHILCLHDRGAYFQVVKESGIPIHVFDYIPQERPVLKMVKQCWKVSRKLKKINPNIIHSFHYSANYTEAIASRMAGAKWTFTKKNMSWGGSSKNAWKLRSMLAKKIAVQNTDMIKQFYPDSDKTLLIPRGVVIEQFEQRTPNPEIRRSMRTTSDKRILICVANFVPVKGIETLIEAFETLRTEFSNWVLWLVGDDKNDYGRRLHKMVNEKNMNDMIVFSGKQMQVVDYLNHAEIFILPTLDEGRREGSPVAMLEAMANGKVVVGSNIPGVKDQMKDKPDHLFHAGDVAALIEKLKPLMAKSREELKQIGEKFYNLAATEYTIEKEVEKHEEMYRKMMGLPT